MRVLIQNCKTENFLTPDHRLTENAHEALSFTNSVRAVQYMRANDFKDVQVLLTFPKREHNVKLPVSDSCKQ